MTTTASLQQRYAPESLCFGCGPANAQGLRIGSRVEGDELVADWTPSPHHLAFPGVLNGGIVGALLDCHSNWAAAWAIAQRRAAAAGGAEVTAVPACVTADFHVKLRAPTPLDRPLHLVARAVELVGDDRAVVEARLEADGRVTATCRGTFVAVKPGHPAYHRW